MDLQLKMTQINKSAMTTLNGIEYNLDYTVDATDAKNAKLIYMNCAVIDKVNDKQVQVGNFKYNNGIVMLDNSSSASNPTVTNFIYTENFAQYAADFQSILKSIVEQSATFTTESTQDTEAKS